GTRARQRNGASTEGTMPEVGAGSGSNRGVSDLWTRAKRSARLGKVPRGGRWCKRLGGCHPGLHPQGGGGMKKPVRSWMYVVASAAVAIAPVAATSGTVSQAATHAAAHAAAAKHVNANQHMHIDCSTAASMGTEVANSDKVC